MAFLIRSNLRDVEREYAVDLAKAVAGERVRVVLTAPGRDHEVVVIGSTERYLIQEQKGHAGEMVLYSRRALLNVDLAVPAQVIGIRYPRGGVGLVVRTDLQADQAYSMQHQRDRDLGR